MSVLENRLTIKKMIQQFKKSISFIGILGLFFFITLSSCHSNKKLSSQNTTKKGIPTSVQAFIENSEVFGQSFTGFALYDPASKKIIFEQDADKYFTPASNTKILTLYTGMQILGDSIPALKYIVQGDSLIFWGTGDPSFLNPYLPENENAFHFLKNRKEKLFFCPFNFMDKRFGAGWAWDDFPNSYQPEKSPFPIHGNIVKFHCPPDGKKINVYPDPFKNLVQPNPTIGGNTASIRRNENENIFAFNQRPVPRRGYKREIPFMVSNELSAELLGWILQKSVNLLDTPLLPPSNSRTIYSVPSDLLYQEMMQESDNFIAEQILLLCASTTFDTLNTRKMINYAIKNLMKDSPDKPIWRDGSGLSRYNLFTPRTMIYLLNKIHQSTSEERIFDIFPTGKTSGTIKNWYGPYVHAKTGTLSNKHCLSGYIKTKKGKTLIFSFMHNNYITSSTPLKKEMEKVLHFIHNKY